MKKITQAGIILTTAFFLSSCIDAKRFSDDYTAVNKERLNPHYQSCERAINKAYTRVNTVKTNTPAVGTYDQWSEINELTAEALSAMENRQYALCEHKAKEIREYLLLNILPRPRPLSRAQQMPFTK